jgi:hypothetical protein
VHIRGSDQPLGQIRGQGVGTPEVLSRSPAVTGSVHHEFEKVTYSRVLGRPGWRSHQGMVGEYGDVLHTSRLYL